MVRVQARLNEQATRILGRLAGISLPQWRILALIGDRERTTSREIVGRSGMDKGLVSRTLKSLMDLGHVQAETSRDDLRIQHLSLTATGRSLYEATLPHMAERQRLIQSAFTKSELAAFETALTRLENLASIEAFDP